MNATAKALPPQPAATHEVQNQPTPWKGNFFDADPILADALSTEGLHWGSDQLIAYGKIAGDELAILGVDANENPPRLRTHDRYGHRIDQIEFHPAWHRCMALAKEHGLHAITWDTRKPGAQLLRSALIYLHGQSEAGTMCPITMTHACVPTLRHEPELAEQWIPRILARSYDPTARPATEKTGLTIGMGMTEKQGGSDVRANLSQATDCGDGKFQITGHKWFFSAPQCDAHLVLAQAAEGLGCFLMPRFRPDGSRNSIRIQRLKDKLGDRSNASSEVEFEEAFAWLVGEPGKGVRTIIEMVAQTRLDCMLGSAALMRQALLQAIHHCRYRSAFGKPLIRQPLMRNVLIDLAIDSEACVRLCMRLARAFDQNESSDREKLFARLATPIGKYWVCKRAPGFVNEAQECLGGAGYVEEFILPRLYRQAPLNSIWEGSGNIQALDVLRAIQRSPESLDVLLDQLRQASGNNRHYDAHLASVEQSVTQPEEQRARVVVEDLALGLQASLLLTAQSPVADTFCRTRLAARHLSYGCLARQDLDAGLLERALPGSAHIQQNKAQ